LNLLYLEALYCIAEHSAGDIQHTVSLYTICRSAIILLVHVKEIILWRELISREAECCGRRQIYRWNW